MPGPGKQDWSAVDREIQERKVVSESLGGGAPSAPVLTAEQEDVVVVACYDCGLAYGSDGWIECVVPNDVWLRISPSGHDGGILCITCIARRLKRIGLDKVPVMLCGTEAIRVADQSESFDRGWKLAERELDALRAEVTALRDTNAVLTGQLQQSRSTVTALRAERDAAYDAGWKSYRDATVRFLRNRAKRYLSSRTTGGASVASDLSDIADSFEAQTGFDGGRPPSPSAAPPISQDEAGPTCTVCGKRATQRDIDGDWWPPCEHAAKLGVETLRYSPSPSAATAEEQTK